MICDIYFHLYGKGKELVFEEVQFAQKERKKGKWIDGFCSECHEEAITEWNECGGEYALTRYCPNCGAEMRGEEE